MVGFRLGPRAAVFRLLQRRRELLDGCLRPLHVVGQPPPFIFPPRRLLLKPRLRSLQRRHQPPVLLLHRTKLLLLRVQLPLCSLPGLSGGFLPGLLKAAW